MSTELATNFIKELEVIQNALVNINDQEGIHGDGKKLVDCKEFPITHNFSDGLYMRQMKMESGSLIVSAMHHTNHFWFLLSGKVVVAADDEVVEHVAPCWSYSIKGTKRLITCVEDCVWINIIANPTNTRDMEEIEDSFFSITLDEYNKKENVCHQ